MNFTITADSLLEYQSPISQFLWTGLLCNRKLLIQLESETEDVMTAVGANCAVTLYPRLATHSIEVSCHWTNDSSEDADRDDFFRVAVADIFIEYVGVLTA